MSTGVWREPAEESVGLYPGLVVHDGRVSGSITVGRSRLPLWALVSTAVLGDWGVVEAGWSPTEAYGYTAEALAEFLYDLLELRGEFARLLLVLAAAERAERRGRRYDRPWWLTERWRTRVGDQLRRCADALDATGRPT